MYINLITFKYSIEVEKNNMEENQEKQETKFDSIRKNIGYVSSMGLLFLILGLIISTQFQSYIAIRRAGIPASRQVNELVSILKQVQSKKEDLEKQLFQVKEELNNANKNALIQKLSDSKFEKIYEVAGLTEVNGKGLIIKLEEQESLNKNINFNNNDGMVHSDDLLKIINELKSAGARAISINNQRLVTTSEVVTAGNNIIINQMKLIPPYIIKAIGPQDTMYSSINIRGGIIEYIEVFGIKVNIYKNSNITISPFKGNL